MSHNLPTMILTFGGNDFGDGFDDEFEDYNPTICLWPTAYGMQGPLL